MMPTSAKTCKIALKKTNTALIGCLSNRYLTTGSNWIIRLFGIVDWSYYCSTNWYRRCYWGWRRIFYAAASGAFFCVFFCFLLLVVFTHVYTCVRESREKSRIGERGGRERVRERMFGILCGRVKMMRMSSIMCVIIWIYIHIHTHARWRTAISVIPTLFSFYDITISLLENCMQVTERMYFSFFCLWKTAEMVTNEARFGKIELISLHSFFVFEFHEIFS